MCWHHLQRWGPIPGGAQLLRTVSLSCTQASTQWLWYSLAFFVTFRKRVLKGKVRDPMVGCFSFFGIDTWWNSETSLNSALGLLPAVLRGTYADRSKPGLLHAWPLYPIPVPVSISLQNRISQCLLSNLFCATAMNYDLWEQCGEKILNQGQVRMKWEELEGEG